MKGINKITKLSTILIVSIMLIMAVSPVFAAVGTAPNSFTGEAKNVNTNVVTDWSNTIINVVSIVGSAAAIVILIVLGIKYMMGSAEEKAEYKKTLLPYAIGAIFVFGAGVLTNVIYNFIQ